LGSLQQPDCFANKFENHWRFNCSRWQGPTYGPKMAAPTGAKTMYRVSGGVRSTHGQDGAIVLDVQQGQMFNLNLVGSKILELLEGGATESDIVNVISRDFNASREIVENDVCEFIESLKRHKLVADR
jgi:hypothetical protein